MSRLVGACWAWTLLGPAPIQPRWVRALPWLGLGVGVVGFGCCVVRLVRP